MKKLPLLIWTLFATFCLYGQDVNPVDFMKMNPYQLNSNPATNLKYYSYAALGTNNICLNIHNSSLRYDNCFQFDAEGRPSVFDLNKLAASLKENNNLSVNANVEIFGMGRRSRYGFIHYGHRVRVQSSIAYGDDLFELAAYGNSAFQGDDNPADIKLNVNLLAYQEFAVGYQIKPTENLSVGARLKFLLGTAQANTDAFSIRLFTNPQTYALRIYEDVAMRAAGVPSLGLGPNGTLGGRFNPGDLFHNPGFGVDLAAEYDLDEHYSVMAAVNDLGFIRWKFNSLSFTGAVSDEGQFYESGSFFYDGLDVDQLQRLVSDGDYREQFMDTLKQYFKINSEFIQPYNTMLHTNILLRGTYRLNDTHRFMAQLQGYCSGVGFRPAMTLAYNATFMEMFDICASYSMMKGSLANLGLGLAGNFGAFHIYFATNNLISALRPLNSNGLNAELGIVFNIRHANNSYFE